MLRRQPKASGLVNNKYNDNMELKATRRKAAKSNAVVCIDTPASWIARHTGPVG